MTVVTTSELQSSLSSLLERVADGEEISIERQGQLVAKLVRIEDTRPDVNAIKDTIFELRRFCVRHSSGGLGIRAMIEEGRP